MAWWDSVASLTPVAAWDALHFADGQLQDQIGSNALTVKGEVAVPYPFYGLSGQEKPWPLATSMPLSGEFVLMGFVMHVGRGLVFYKALGDSSSYFLDQESNGLIYQYANGTGGQAGTGPAWGTQKFMALAVSASDARVYINNNWAGAAFTSAWVPDSVGGIGYYADGNEYNLGSSERFYAAGLWTGAASLADLRALEAACRAALAGPPVGVRAAALSHQHSPNSDQWNQSVVYPRQFRALADACRNIHFGGGGKITGTVKEKGQPDHPLVRQVLLYSENAHTLVATTWSDVTGNYRFEHLDPTQRYTVISHDYRQMYRAVIADNLKPDLMP